MKSFALTLFASALALAAGCSSNASEGVVANDVIGDDTASNTESLRAPPIDPTADPCAAVRCAAGTECVVVDGNAACVEPDLGINPCSLVLCAPDTTCEVIDGEASCVPPAPELCAAVSCITGTVCEEIDGKAVCVPPAPTSCAAVSCLTGNNCEVIDGEAVCVPVEPEVDACATVRCIAGTECVIDDGKATCQPVDPNPCAVVLCPTQTECEVVDGDAVCSPIESAPFCGGFAGFECPGAGLCVDDPTDDCDPENGGADCGGACICPVLALCVEGFVFDDSAAVCECVPAPEENPCALVDCFPNQVCEVVEGEGVCVPVAPNPCAAVLCPVDTECVVDDGEASCESIEHDCR